MFNSLKGCSRQLIHFSVLVPPTASVGSAVQLRLHTFQFFALSHPGAGGGRGFGGGGQGGASGGQNRGAQGGGAQAGGSAGDDEAGAEGGGFGGRFRGGGFGPAAIPGEYTIKLRAGGKELSKTVQVKLDPRIKISDEDLAAQLAAAQEAAALSASLNDVVSRIDDLTR